MQNKNLETIMRAYDVVKKVLGKDNISREDELKNPVLMRILDGLYYEFRDENGLLYDDNEDIYIYCGNNQDPEKSFLFSLGGKRVVLESKQELKEFVNNNIVLFHSLDFVPSTDKMSSVVLPTIREDYYLKAFDRDNEDKAKIFVLNKYAHMHKESQLNKIYNENR